MLTGGKFLDWFDLSGVLSRAAYVVGNDTGPTHIAAHLNCEGLALFGPHTSARATSMDTRRMQVIETDALADLAVDAVLERTRQALAIS